MLLISVTYGNTDLEDCLRNIVSLFHHVDKEIAWRESVGKRVGFETLLQSEKPVVAIGPKHPLVENATMAELFGGSKLPEESLVTGHVSTTDGHDGPRESHSSVCKHIRRWVKLY